jgi:hypothetical protein
MQSQDNNASSLSTMEIINQARNAKQAMRSTINGLIIKWVLFALPVLLLTIGLAFIQVLMFGHMAVIFILGKFVLSFLLNVITYNVFANPATIFAVRTMAGMKNDIATVRNDISNASSLLKPFVMGCAALAAGLAVANFDIVPLIIHQPGTRVVIQLLFGLGGFIIFLPIAYFSIPLIVTKRYGAEKALISGFNKMAECWLPVILSFVLVVIAFFFLNLLAGLLIIPGVIISIFVSKILGGLITLVITVYVMYRIFLAYTTLYYAMIGYVFCKAYGLHKMDKSQGPKKQEPLELPPEENPDVSPMPRE